MADVVGQPTSEKTLVVYLREWGTALGTRARGQVVRRELEESLRADPERVVIVDFSGVEQVSPSFADECFGKLAAGLGAEGMRRRLRFASADGTVAKVVIYAISNRLTSKAIADSSTPADLSDER